MAPSTSPIALNNYQRAKLTMLAGCPRTADVKAAKNALYLLSIGKAGGLTDSAAYEATVTKHNEFQAARRLLNGPAYAK